MSPEHEHREEPAPRDEGKRRSSNVLALAITLTLLVAACTAIAAFIHVISTLDPHTVDKKKLEELGFSNIQLESVKETTRAWVSVGGCRLQLERVDGTDENWHLFGESVVAGISGEPTAEQIRKHEKYAVCATKPAPGEQTR